LAHSASIFLLSLRYNFILQKLIFVPQSDDESDDEEEPGEKPAVNKNGSAGSSSSDDNDSAAAAHAAAIGHSPQLNPSSKIAAEANDGDKTTEMDIEEAESANATGEEAEAQQPKPKKVTYFCPHNINERDDDENTPLHVAIHTRKLEHIKLLLQAGASVYKKCDGSPPIHTAISIGSVAKHAQFAYEATVVLTENGADLSSKDDAMHTPLYLACMYNLPQIASYILSSESGQATLNSKADRSGGRALHAAAKFDTAANLKFSNSAAAAVTGHGKMAAVSHHHPDGTVPTSMHHIPGFPGKQLDVTAPSPEASEHTASAQALLTQVLLEQSEIEIDVTNTVGQTALHIACGRGNWSVVRLLLQAGANPSIADRRGFSPGQHAHKRGMPIPNDLLSVLGDPPSSGTVAPPRDLIVDPDGNTCIITHELCVLHKTCPPIRRDAHAEPPPENVRRLTVLIDEEIGILRSGEFNSCVWQNETRRAAIVDVLKVSRKDT
jgi:ankyrin repeat protein